MSLALGDMGFHRPSPILCRPERRSPQRPESKDLRLFFAALKRYSFVGGSRGIDAPECRLAIKAASAPEEALFQNVAPPADDKSASVFLPEGVRILAQDKSAAADAVLGQHPQKSQSPVGTARNPPQRVFWHAGTERNGGSRGSDAPECRLAIKGPRGPGLASETWEFRGQPSGR